MTGKTDLEAKIKQLEEKLEKLNRSYQEDEALLDSIPVLRGDAAKQFEEYNNRPRTNDEVRLAKEAHDMYLLCDAEERIKRRNERLARAILTDKYDGETRWQLRKNKHISVYDVDLILSTFKDIVRNDVAKNLNNLDEL